MSTDFSICWRAKLISDSGTQLSKRGVLTSGIDQEQGAQGKPKSASPPFALGSESSKKKRKSAITIAG